MFTEKVKFPAVVGIPEMRPVPAFNSSPLGKEPFTTEKARPCPEPPEIITTSADGLLGTATETVPLSNAGQPGTMGANTLYEHTLFTVSMPSVNSTVYDPEVAELNGVTVVINPLASTIENKGAAGLNEYW
jgi:hypothetical protein